MRARLAATLIAAIAVAAAARAAEPAPDPMAEEQLRAVVVEDGADTVELWIAVPASIDPDSIEVQLAGRVLVVLARDDAGRPLRSAPIRLRQPVVEEGAAARYEGPWLAISLKTDPSAPPEF